jgi:hypothetical protein
MIPWRPSLIVRKKYKIKCVYMCTRLKMIEHRTRYPLILCSTCARGTELPPPHLTFCFHI